MSLVPPVSCPRCGKRPDLCVCEAIRPLDTKISVLILQHPQEPDKELGSARLTQLALANSVLRVGLSWPNLKKALGREATPSRWAVLHLGSGIQGKSDASQALCLVDRKGVPLPEGPGLFKDLEGIVVLDGTWSQAKTLWWRNAWLLKLRRAILNPQARSLYRELRREPRRECLSTIESVAIILRALGESEQTTTQLFGVFENLLARYRTLAGAGRRGLGNA